MRGEIRKAIEFLEYIITIADERYNEDSIQKKDKIIALLKRGEAFEKIVEGFKEIFYTNPHNWVTKEYYANEIKKLEQKYLKEAKGNEDNSKR